jgi:hypothetical protein
MTTFVLMLTVPDNLIQNVEYWTVRIQTLVRVIFRVSLKQSKLWKAAYISIQHGKWLLISLILNYQWKINY